MTGFVICLLVLTHLMAFVLGQRHEVLHELRQLERDR